MKIASIDNQRSFKGLWGETIKTNEQKLHGNKMVLANYETRLYYPFGDESIEDVNKIMKNNTTYKRIIENDSDILSIKQSGTDINVKQPLLFSAKQWFQYISNKLELGSVECRLIEENLRRLHLEKYIRV